MSALAQFLADCLREIERAQLNLPTKSIACWSDTRT